MDDEMAKMYTSVGVDCVTYSDEGKVAESVGLLFPTETSAVDGEFEVKYMTLAAAKSLLIDLRDAIDNCIKHAMGEEIEGD